MRSMTGRSTCLYPYEWNRERAGLIPVIDGHHLKSMIKAYINTLTNKTLELFIKKVIVMYYDFRKQAKKP